MNRFLNVIGWKDGKQWDALEVSTDIAVVSTAGLIVMIVCCMSGLFT